MRTLVTISIPTQSGNRAVQSGQIRKLIQQFVDAAKPEAAYFTVLGGQRTMIAVIDMAEAASMPLLLEPLFMQLDAEIELTPVMDLADLQKGLGAL